MKIALIAMSGVRAVDQTLLELGLTLPGFVERSRTIASLPSLGLLTLAGLTPPGHEVLYLEVDQVKDLGHLPPDIDFVAISTFSAQVLEAYELADRLRAEGVPVVMGGPHVSVLPEEALEHVDAVAVGEGESVWPQILEAAEAGRLRGVFGARDGLFDFANAPMPRFELLDIDRYNRLTVQTHRGCPHRCEFCAASPLLTPRYKQKPLAKVLAEIDRIRELWPAPFLEFADDNSLVNREYWRELARELQKRHLRWFTETDISIAEDSALLAELRESGCAQLLIGLESPVPTGLDGLEMKRNWKRARLDRYRDAIQEIQRHGITVNGCFILGLDGQGPEVFDAVCDFVEDSGLYEVQITLLTPFPGTPLYARLQREGRLLEPGRWDKCTLFDVNFQPSHMSVAELETGFHTLTRRLYNEAVTNCRRERFKQNLRQQLKLRKSA